MTATRPVKQLVSLLGIAAVLLLATGLIGYWIGASRSPISMHACPVYSAATQASATCADGWAYDVPVNDVAWLDAQGTLHLTGRPDCVPPSDHQLGPITFGSVTIRVNGSEMRPVVFVSCH